MPERTDNRRPIPRLVIAAIAVLFLAPRVVLLFVRQFFFDELFTHWIAGKSYAGILDALRFDSGPPLYYWLLQLAGNPPLTGARALSLLFATAALIAILAEERLGQARFAASALIAVFPPAVLFSVDARAYALCAMCVTFGVIALATERPWAAAAGFLLAAYCHYYGVLFFPLLVRRWRTLAAVVALYLPGFWLAMHQPADARTWMAFAYPDALFARPPLLLAIGGALLLIAAAVTSPNRYALMALVPLALAIILGVYVPLRFESVIAAPLALWLSVGAAEAGRARTTRTVGLVLLIVAFAVWTALGILDHARRPPDEYRAAATWVARNVPADQIVVASGYLYLETIAQRPAAAFPPEQAQHPGWRAAARPGSSLPSVAFLWIGERASPELDRIRRARRVTPLYVNSRAIVVKVH